MSFSINSFIGYAHRKKSFHISVGSGHKILDQISTICDQHLNYCGCMKQFPLQESLHITLVALHIMQWVYCNISVGCAVEHIL